MRDRRVRRQKSERPSWQASPFLWWVVRVDPKSFCNAHIRNSGFLQHLAKLLGCRRYDGDEIGLAKPALGAMALQVTARATMQHRRARRPSGEARRRVAKSHRRRGTGRAPAPWFRLPDRKAAAGNPSAVAA